MYFNVEVLFFDEESAEFKALSTEIKENVFIINDIGFVKYIYPLSTIKLIKEYNQEDD